MIETIALFAATVVMAGIGLWAAVSALALIYVAVGFTGALSREVWPGLLVATVVACAAFWVAYEIAPFSVQVGR